MWESVRPPRLDYCLPFVVALIIVSTCALVGCYSVPPPAQPRLPTLAASPVPDLGLPAPDFSLTNLGGETIKLSDYLGRTMLINFFATWCVPCRQEMRAIEAAYQKHQRDGFIVLAIDVEESRSSVVPFIEELGLTFVVLIDSSGEVTHKYNVRAFPTSFFIDEQRIIRAMQFGPMDEEIIETNLAQILEGSNQ